MAKINLVSLHEICDMHSLIPVSWKIMLYIWTNPVLGPGNQAKVLRLALLMGRIVNLIVFLRYRDTEDGIENHQWKESYVVSTATGSSRKRFVCVAARFSN